jgi:hypothetical protein
MSKFAPAPGRVPVIADLVRDGQRLEVWCCRCDRCEQIAPERAVELLGPNTTFPEACVRLTCSACGARGREKWIQCRPSVEDFYARLHGLGGLRLPGCARNSHAPETPSPDATEPRRSHPKRGRSRGWRG